MTEDSTMVPLIPLHRITVDEYADSLRTSGVRLCRVGGTWWREVRPFFFRPAMPFMALAPGQCEAPKRALIGGFQHAVALGTEANSTLNVLAFGGAGTYSIESLRSPRRWQVRAAARRFSVRPLSNCAEFKAKAHEPYLDFYRRTGYRYLADRVRKTNFDQWSDRVFGKKGALVLGAFSDREKLRAAGIAYVVEDWMIYSTFFADREAMRQNVSSLMLHAIRTLAADSRLIGSIFVGMRKAGAEQSIDDFYLQRGCSIRNMPARLKLNPLVSWGLRVSLPAAYRLLIGDPLAETTHPTCHK